MRGLLFFLLVTFFNASFSQNNSGLTVLKQDTLEYVESGKKKFNSKDYSGAIADFDKAIELLPNNYLSHLLTFRVS
jgi:hypothetical protein